MRRKKRHTLVRIALGMAVVAAILPVSAQAKQYEAGPGEIPYLSHGKGVNSSNFGLVLGSDDRNLARTSVGTTPEVVIPYLSQGEGVTSAELGFAVGKSPDDRSFARGTTLDSTQVVSDGGISIDVSPYAMTGFGLAMLLAMGIGVGIWHSRRARLSPA